MKKFHFSKGFLEGFLTLDAIGALVLSTIVVNAIRQNGIQEKKSIAKIYNHLRKHRCSILNNCLLLTRLYRSFKRKLRAI
ncbi:branched-chain amino acid transport system II carrier protein [Bacillus pacificus]